MIFKNNIFFSFLTLIFSFLLLVNCGGGGGSSSSSTATNYVTDEYNAQYGLGNIKASSAYDRGYNGDGIKVERAMVA